MHRDQDPRLDGEDEVVGAGLEHCPLPGIHREEGHVDLLPGDRLDGLAEFLVRFLDLLFGGFFPPVPEIQVSGMEEAQAEEIHQEADAQVRGIKGGDGHFVRKPDGIPGRHALPAGADRHIRGDDPGDVPGFVPGEDDRIQVIDMFVADENEYFVIRAELFGCQLQLGCQLPALPAPVVKDQQRMFSRDGKTAMVIMGNQKRMLHADVYLHGPWPIKN